MGIPGNIQGLIETDHSNALKTILQTLSSLGPTAVELSQDGIKFNTEIRKKLLVTGIIIREEGLWVARRH